MEGHTNPVIVLSGGEPLVDPGRIEIPHGATVIAADSGLHHADALGLEVHLVVGDMDSVDPARLRSAVAQGTSVDRHPVDKDRTDLELAIVAALDTGARRLMVVGAYSGRLDHLLGAMGLIAATASAVDEITWTDGRTRVLGCTPGAPTIVEGRAGDVVSLLPASPAVDGVTTGGLRWALTGETLHAGSTRGISNVIESSPASVVVERGTILVVHERTAA